jgi:hypothetical protein
MSEVDPSKPVALEHRSESGTYAFDSRRSLLDMSSADGDIILAGKRSS